ncbi:constitutive coactivator of peroxisome proliferator-activated receptor gamma-like isoform X2 [Oratosquilla oratoria]|uniref:constitutive coactivator of peroxisome proliferator-activated receptor gamma-like isoform X2 n=1 Tax=Oratosquilla oratoria TaxID=337810 RepID=UPI003F76A84C
MGVRGLQTFLESHCGAACYSVNMGKVAEEYHKRTGKDPIIIVDGMSCLRKLYGKLNWICGGQWKGYIDHIRHFIKSLEAHGIKLIFFYDGNTQSRKRDTWVHRRLENLKDITTIFNIIKHNKELEHGKQFFLPTGLAAFTPLTIKEVLGCEVYICLDECDTEVAEFAKRKGAMGILGQDSDYLIYNTAHYYFSINHLNIETLDTMVYDRAALARVLHIGIDQLPLLSCLIGNDVIPQERLQLFHKYVMKDAHSHHHHRSHHNRPPPEILIPKMGGFINSQPPMDQLMHQLPQLAKAVFRDENMASMLNEGINMYKLNLDGPNRFLNLPEEEQAHSFMERAQIRHIKAHLGRHLYTILRGEPYESSTTLEDYSSVLPSGALVYRPLRARVYCILQKSAKGGLQRVAEWCMYSGNAMKAPDMVEPEPLPEGTPSLEELWNGTDELKWSTFLDCIHPDLKKTNIRTMPLHLVFPAAILYYMQYSSPKPILKDWEVNAIIAGFLSSVRDSLTQIRAIVLPRIDARAVHIGALFMKGAVNLYFLHAACGTPFERSKTLPIEYWDGKVFHHYYLRAKGGARIEDLCEHNEDILNKFMELKMMVVSATANPAKRGSPSHDRGILCAAVARSATILLRELEGSGSVPNGLR